MTWTSAKPTSDGHYWWYDLAPKPSWYRPEREFEPTVVLVSRGGTEVEFLGNDTVCKIAELDGLWYGPLNEPSPPSLDEVPRSLAPT